MSCPCKNLKCPRHGKCGECIDYHRQRGELTACEKIMAENRKKIEKEKDEDYLLYDDPQ